MRKPIVQSHRGGGVLTPENTLESFAATWEAGAIPEADLRTTRDGVIVAFHDADFARVVKNLPPELSSHGVKDVTWETLSRLNVGQVQGREFAPQRVCRIEKIFAALQPHQDWALYLDIKDVDLPQLANLALAFDVAQRVILAAPREQILREWMELVPTGQTLLWMGIGKNGGQNRLRARIEALRDEAFAGLTQLQIHVEAARKGDRWEFKPSLGFLSEVAPQLRAAGVLFQTLPWDCDQADVYRALLDAGVESFASDYPAVALEVLRERSDDSASDDSALAIALRAACETKALCVGANVLGQTPHVFREQFGEATAIVVCDATTFKIAGRAVVRAFADAGHTMETAFIFADAQPHADFETMEKLEVALKRSEAIPVAVGSGVINDLVKLAAHRAGRPYACVATAASMDGYTAFGASITHEGSKQTFTCPAPIAVVADLEILRHAPRELTASGYADLLAKVPAGADWLLADALQIEPLDPTAWSIAQDGLPAALGDPHGVAAGQSTAIRRLTEGLMLGGFAMQWAKTSRPASGAEHQFSHLWDMQHHTHQGTAPSHGFKVGIGTLAVTALYEWLLEQPLEQLDVEECCARWPESEQIAREARQLLGELAPLGERESAAKYPDRAQLGAQLQRLREVWPELKSRLRAQLIPFAEVEERLRVIGAPHAPEQIGISRARLRQSYRQAALIRRRFTVLDLALRTDTLDAALDHIFGTPGPWPLARGANFNQTNIED